MNRAVSRDLETDNTATGSLVPNHLSSSGRGSVTLASGRVIVGGACNACPSCDYGQGEGDGCSGESDSVSHDLRIAYPWVRAISFSVYQTKKFNHAKFCSRSKLGMVIDIAVYASTID